MKIKIIFTLISMLLLSGAADASVSTTRKYKDVISYLNQIHTNFPDRTEIFTLGYSNAGVAIQGIKIGNGSVANLLVGAHHGNEYGSTEVALHFAESVAAQPLSDQTMYVIPVLNINGYDRRNRYESVNGHSVDPNRDYPGPCGSEGPFNSNSTKALADFIDKQKIVASATIHTYWPAVVYPWGFSTRDVDTHYTNEFINMAKDATSVSNYQIGNSGELIYPANGTFEDYAFWKHGVWSVLFEAGHTHSPNINQLNELVSENIPGLRKMFENAPRVNAAIHDFTGKCDYSWKAFDPHIE